MKREATFAPGFFRQLKSAEDRHFWFCARRRWIFDRIRTHMPPPAKLLEIGCGTGNVSSYLSRKGYRVTGCDFYREALEIAWPGFTRVQGDASSLPFQDNSFDLVGLFDVIEHFADDAALVREAGRVARRGGIVAVTVPAREELWSHTDEDAFHKRRYAPEDIRRVFSDAGLSVLRVEYYFMVLYLPLRWMRRKRRDTDEIFRIHPLVNVVMKGLLLGEHLVSKMIPMPIGTSLICIGCKKQGKP